MDFNNNEWIQGDVEARLWFLECLVEEAENIKREHHITNLRSLEAVKQNAADIVLLKELFSQKRIDEFETLEQKINAGLKESEADIAQIKEFNRRFVIIIRIFIRFSEGLQNVPGFKDTVEAFSKITESFYDEEEDPDQPGV